MGGEFGTCAEFTIAAGNVLCVDGIFTDATEQTDMMTGQIETVNAMFDCQTSALNVAGSVVTNKMAVEIEGTTYQVERLQRLGTGITTVHLKT